MITVGEAAIIGAAGILVGAVLGGAVQIWVSTSERRQDRDERRREAKRSHYEHTLRLVMNLPDDWWDAVTGSLDFHKLLAPQMIELQIGKLLDASPEVGRETDALMAAVVTWVTHAGKELKSEHSKGMSATDIINMTFEEDVRPSLVRTADAMSKELDSR